MLVVQESAAPSLQAYRFVAIGCVLAAIALVVLDAAIVNVALPAIALSLHVGVAVSVQVVTAYQMALVMALLPVAAIGESLGCRRVYASGVALFVGASALCAWAPSLELLLAARFLQGVGGAAIMSLGIALLRASVDARQLGRAIGWNTLTVGLASAAGPTVGALVLSFGSWRWLFAVNLPLGLLVLLGTRSLPAVAGGRQVLDVVSMALHAIAFGALVIGGELVSDRAGLATIVVAASAVVMAILVRRERPKDAPLIPLDLLRQGSFRISVIASVCCFVGQSAAMVSLSFYFQRVLRLDALHTGLLITPWPLSVAVVAPTAGRLVDRLSGAWLCALGGLLLSAGLACVALLPAESTQLSLVAAIALCGLGFGLFQVSNNRNLLMSAAPLRSGAAGGIQSTARLTGQALGAVVMTLIFSRVSMDLAPRIGLGVAAALAMAAGLISTLRSAPVPDGKKLHGASRVAAFLSPH
ncbi:MAG: Family ership [Pseudomonadota bacterium]|jgi:DHA2 family multidrug resistance protein-like MFS transporter